MLAIEFSDDALRDLNGIWDYIAPEYVRAAVNLLDDIQDVMTKLRSFPHIGRVFRMKPTALYLHSVRGYAIFYEVTDREINIVRVLHGARDIDAILDR